MRVESTAERWLPVTFKFNPHMVSVQWVQFGPKPISEPFFGQTVRKLKRSKPVAEEQVTTLTALIERARELTPVTPAGLIFHVSRCGSTLLANALRAGQDVVVLSEARPVGTFFRPNVFRESPFPSEGWEDARRMLLGCVATIYAHSGGSGDPKLVIKCHAASVLQIGLVRAVWPDVPFVVSIRDPLAVMMSLRAKPATWVKTRNRPRIGAYMFGWKPTEVLGMSVEEYCARGLGRFCEVAAGAIGPNCRVIDYESLDSAHIRRIADFFGIALPAEDSPEFRKVLGTYAKDPSGVRPFESDRERKQREAPATVRRAAETWAQRPYETLRRLEAW
jgi:hypothetical protein